MTRELTPKEREAFKVCCAEATICFNREALAVAGAYETAAQRCEKLGGECNCEAHRLLREAGAEIRALTPADAQAAIEQLKKSAISEFLAVIRKEGQSNSVKDWIDAHDRAIRQQERERCKAVLRAMANEESLLRAIFKETEVDAPKLFAEKVIGEIDALPAEGRDEASAATGEEK